MDPNTKILIVDDIPSARKVLTRLLAKLGYTNLVEASCGNEALIKLDEDSFNLVICDVNLGDIKGLEVLKKARSTQELKGIPFVLITSDPSREDVLMAAEAGQADFLLKPFSRDALQDRIDEAMRSEHPLPE